MSVLEFGFLVLAGIGAGLTGSIAGLASLISYPALLAIGLPPVTANVTNTVALVLNSVGSVSASRPELEGQGSRCSRSPPPRSSAARPGGAAAVTPPEAFERVVPFLIAARSAAILVQRPPASWPPRAPLHHPDHRDPPLAAARHLRHRDLRRLLRRRRRRADAGDVPARHRRGPPPRQRLKNVVLGVANAVAALGFICLRVGRPGRRRCPWRSGCSSAAGSDRGCVRRAPQTALRRVIAVAGLGAGDLPGRPGRTR